MPSTEPNLYGSWMMESPDEIIRNFLRYECPLSRLELFANSKNLTDPRREIARQFLKEAYERVFADEKPRESPPRVCNHIGTLPYAHGSCPFCK